MRLYFSTQQIPALKELPLTERMQRLQAAEKRLTVPERLLLNLFKLLILVPIFVFILRVNDSWLALLWAALVALAYPLLLKPLQYSLSAKYLEKPKESS